MCLLGLLTTCLRCANRFTLKAKAAGSDTVEEGYKFDKPIVVSMLCKCVNTQCRVTSLCGAYTLSVPGGPLLCGSTDSVKSILDGKSAATDWEPSLNIYDVTSGKWIPAKETCPPELQWDEIVHEERRYSVNVCHLTQVRVWC